MCRHQPSYLFLRSTIDSVKSQHIWRGTIISRRDYMTRTSDDDKWLIDIPILLTYVISSNPLPFKNYSRTMKFSDSEREFLWSTKCRSQKCLFHAGFDATPHSTPLVWLGDHTSIRYIILRLKIIYTSYKQQGCFSPGKVFWQPTSSTLLLFYFHRISNENCWKTLSRTTVLFLLFVRFTCLLFINNLCK